MPQPDPRDFAPDRMIDAFCAEWPASRWQTVTVVVAVSGGADSVALLRLMDSAFDLAKRNTPQSNQPADACATETADGLVAPANGRLVVAHFDHGWRDDSASDAQFVAELARTLGWECVIGHNRPDDSATKGTTPSESSARDARYEFLNSVAAEVGARYLVTAHTANDQAETVLHRILRGTGLRGMAGIPRIRVVNESLTIVRPLLPFRRSQLEAYLSELDQDFVTDPTNSDQSYTRNRIRHGLLPQLREQYNSEVDSALLTLANLCRETQTEVESIASSLCDAACTFCDEEVTIERSKLNGNSGLVIRELLRTIWQRQRWPLADMGFEQWTLLLELATGSAQKKTATMPGNVAVKIESRFVRIAKS